MEELFEFKGKKKPKIESINGDQQIKFYLSKKDLDDYDTFCSFINGVKAMVRRDPRYTNYKAHLYELGHDKCQIHGDITSEMAPIEMHHGPIFSMFDLCAIVTDHLLKEEDYVNSFIVSDRVLTEHEKFHIQTVMLCETCHEAAENRSLFISYRQGFGQIDKFIKKYNRGLVKEHRGLIKEYLKLSRDNNSTDNGIYELLDKVKKYTK